MSSAKVEWFQKNPDAIAELLKDVERLRAAVRVFLRWWDGNHPDDAHAVETLRELVE